MKLSELKKMERTVEVAFGGLAVAVTYGMEQFTGAAPAAPRPFVLAVVKRWDLTDDDGAPIPITEDGLAEVPYPFIEAVADTVQRDARPGNAPRQR